MISTLTPLPRHNISKHIRSIFSCISTRRPSRGATRHGWQGDPEHLHFYSYSPAGATSTPTVTSRSTEFLLTRLLRGATATAPSEISGINISTHTPHAGRDPDNQMATTWQPDFYSHASCEARLLGVETNITNWQFLLTRLLRGATFAILIAKMPNVISTHTPHAGRDRPRKTLPFPFCISTHTPHAGRDYHLLTLSGSMEHFYSHAPCGARQRVQIDGSTPT